MRLLSFCSLPWVFAVFVFSAAAVFAVDPVEFADSRLKIVIAEQLQKENPIPQDMLELWALGHHWDKVENISSLKGLEYAKNLNTLSLESCVIEDFSVLAHLENLSSLSLDSCTISNLSSLVDAIEALPRLHHLSLVGNQIDDITALGKMVHLKTLDLSGNHISDITPLLQLKQLDRLVLRDNPLNANSRTPQLQEIRKNNPGIYLPVAFTPQQLILPGILGLILFCLGIVFIYRKRTEKGWVFELAAGLVSAGVGCYFGLGAQFLYTHEGELPMFGNGYENPLWVGGGLGGVFGCLAGIWFVQYLRRLLSTGHGNGGIVGRGIGAGIVLGVVCSVVVHGLLMIAYRNMRLEPLLIGTGFGIGTGTTTGLVLSMVFIWAATIGLVKKAANAKEAM